LQDILGYMPYWGWGQTLFHR